MESDVEAVKMRENYFKPVGGEFIQYHPFYNSQLAFPTHWAIFERDNIEYELYWQGCILVCSKGTSNQKVLIKSVTLDLPISQATITNMCNEHQELENYIVIISDVNVHFYAFTGQDVTRALPFHDAVMWPLNPGLIIHKKQCSSAASRGEDGSCCTVTLSNPLDEFSYISINTTASRESLGRESVLDATQNLVAVITDEDIKYIVCTCKNTLTIWKMGKVNKSVSDMQSPTVNPPNDDIEGLKSNLGMAIFTPNSNTTKMFSNANSKTQMNRERTPSTNLTSFLHTLPNLTVENSSVQAATCNNTVFNSTRICALPHHYTATKVYSEGGYVKGVKCVKGETSLNYKYIAILNTANSITKCMMLNKDHSLSNKHFSISSVDLGYLSTSKLLVVINPVGYVYLYDGPNQLVRLTFSIKDSSLRYASKKPRKRSSSEDILASHITDCLSDSFLLKEHSGHVHVCHIPILGEVPIVRDTLGSVQCLMSQSDYNSFYTLLIAAYLKYYDIKPTWEILSSAIYSFLGIPNTECEHNNTITLFDKSVRRTRHSQVNEDWEYVLNTMKREVTEGTFALPILTNISLKENAPSSVKLNGRTGPMLQILHMMYTEYSLNVHYTALCDNLAALVHHISHLGGYTEYTRFYSSQYPHLPGPRPDAANTSGGGAENLYDNIKYMLAHTDRQLVNCLPGVTLLTEAVIILFTILTQQPLNNKAVKYLKSGSNVAATRDCSNVAATRDCSNVVDRVVAAISKYNTMQEKLLVAMVTLDITVVKMERLPCCVKIPLLDCLYALHCSPPTLLPDTAYQLIYRNDIISTGNGNYIKEQRGKEEPTGSTLDLRFPEDKRVSDVARMFTTDKPVKIVVERKPEMTDSEYIDQQELLLFNKTKRTMAIPVGNALFTFGTLKPSPTKPVVIPDVCIAGKALPRGNTVNLDLEIPADMTHWTEFHSGVAAGLRIDPELQEIDSQWIVYNRPQDLNNKHAGFLLALGLTGHLKKLSSRNLHDYLCQRHKFTSIGLLLGLGVTKRGSQDETTTKLFSIHIPALLPPTAVPLELDHLVQTAAITGLGLIYMGSAHRRMAEILLEEIGRSPGPEMDNAEDREGYSLACGFSLGLILLGLGNENLPGLDDLKLTDRLYKYINGGKKDTSSPTLPHSFRIWEGSMVNTCVCSIGAVVALGFTFLKTGNYNIARTLAAPHTEFLLEGVRPDMLLLRTVCYGLIMWEDIMPTTDWVTAQIPEVLLDCLDVLTGVSQDPAGATLKVDSETSFSCTLTIIAGACFGIALRFAGTCNKAAFNTIYFYLKTVHRISRNPADYAGFSKDLTEMCLVSLLVSCAIVMAGSGNLVLVRLVRQLRKRIVPVNTYGHNFVTYGCHMGIHMALGLLFLGGGRYTLRRDNDAIAALFISFYPIFQTCQDDNTYHLQALRHLWVIAAQPRLLITIDEDTREPCYVPLTVTTVPDCVPGHYPPARGGTAHPPSITRTLFTPAMLPEYQQIQKVEIIGERYWPITISDTEKLRSGYVFVKKRTGYLEYKEDPEGKINLLGRTFGDRYTSTIIDTIKTFSKDKLVILFGELFCVALESSKSVEFCKKQLLDCVIKEKTQLLSYFLMLYKTFNLLTVAPNPKTVQEIRIILGYYANSTSNLISPQMLSQLCLKIEQMSQIEIANGGEEYLLNHMKTCGSERFYEGERSQDMVSEENVVNSGEEDVIREIITDISIKPTVEQDTIAMFQKLLLTSGY